MRVAVCGGRNYGIANNPDYSIPIELVKTGEQASAEQDKLTNTLDAIHAETPITLIIHGGAKGADTLAGEWARINNVDEKVFEAQWRKYGISAGFKRNIQITEQDPDLVVAFPGGKGTAMMIDISKRRGLDVRVIT